MQSNPSEAFCFLQTRRASLISLLAQKSPQVPPDQPFCSSDYPHVDLMSGLYGAAWSGLRGGDPTDIVGLNPLAAGRRGPGTLATWDAALAAPCCMRCLHPTRVNEVTVRRALNAEWGDTYRALLRSGPLGEAGTLLRPRGPLFFDYMADPLGPQLLELAHVVARERADQDAKQRNLGDRYGGPAATHLLRCVAEIAANRVYGTPVDLSPVVPEPGAPSLPYGTMVAVSTRFYEPIMTIPWCRAGAPIPDYASSVLLASVFVQPPPYASKIGLSKPGPHDAWCCTPSLVTFAGFEYMDFILNGATVSANPERDAPIDYGQCVENLMPASDYRHHTWLGAQMFASPEAYDKAHGRQRTWTDPVVYLNTEDYARRRAATHKWPDPECLLINTESSVAPERPRTRVRTLVEAQQDAEFKQWLADKHNIFQLWSKAWEARQTAGMVPLEKKIWRKEQSSRMRLWHERQREYAKRRRWTEAALAYNGRGNLTVTRNQALQEMRAELGDAATEQFIKDVYDNHC